MKRRGEFEQAFDVIDAVVNRKNCCQSDIRRAANLDTTKVRRFLKILTENGVFTRRPPEIKSTGSPRAMYNITTFGRDTYKTMQQIMTVIGSNDK